MAINIYNFYAKYMLVKCSNIDIQSHAYDNIHPFKTTNFKTSLGHWTPPPALLGYMFVLIS